MSYSFFSSFILFLDLENHSRNLSKTNLTPFVTEKHENSNKLKNPTIVNNNDFSRNEPAKKIPGNILITILLFIISYSFHKIVYYVLLYIISVSSEGAPYNCEHVYFLYCKL